MKKENNLQQTHKNVSVDKVEEWDALEGDFTKPLNRHNKTRHKESQSSTDLETVLSGSGGCKQATDVPSQNHKDGTLWEQTD